MFEICAQQGRTMEFRVGEGGAREVRVGEVSTPEDAGQQRFNRGKISVGEIGTIQEFPRPEGSFA